LNERMKQLKISFDEIDKKKYQALVDDVMADLKKGSDVTSMQVKKLGKYLKDDYGQMASK
jgi:hypothetical protein